MHSRCDKHPFSILSGQGEHRMTDMCSCGFIQQKIFPFSRRNVELLFTDHIVEFICIYPGCIDDHFCFVHCILCADPISTFHASLNCFHFLLQTEVHTILRCILCQCVYLSRTDRQSRLSGAYTPQQPRQQYWVPSLSMQLCQESAAPPLRFACLSPIIHITFPLLFRSYKPQENHSSDMESPALLKFFHHFTAFYI